MPKTVLDKRPTRILAVLVISATFGKTIRGESEHRTRAAAEKVSDFYCYKCDTIIDDETCLNIRENSTAEKCDKEYRICQVQTITMSTPTEDKPTNKPPILWLLKRGCAQVCEPVCVTIGERTKLKACNTCCQTSYCNTGNGTTSVHRQFFTICLQLILMTFLTAVVSSSSSSSIHIHLLHKLFVSTQRKRIKART